MYTSTIHTNAYCDQFHLNLPVNSEVPLTFSVADTSSVPASLEALHVYVPLCLYPTFVIISILALVPIMVVVTEGSDETTAPFRNQLIRKGSSPLRTKHVSCAMSPSFTESVPKLNGTICGGSEISNWWVHIKPKQFNFQFNYGYDFSHEALYSFLSWSY